jgi:hypothetical protein
LDLDLLNLIDQRPQHLVNFRQAEHFLGGLSMGLPVGISERSDAQRQQDGNTDSTHAVFSLIAASGTEIGFNRFGCSPFSTHGPRVERISFNAGECELNLPAAKSRKIHS